MRGERPAGIGVAPLVRTGESQESQYDFVLDEARRRRDDEVRKRLREIGRPPHETVIQALAMEPLAGRYGAVFHRKPNRIRVLLHCLPVFAVLDLDSTGRELEGRGFRPEAGPIEIPDGPCYLFRDRSNTHLAVFGNVRPDALTRVASDAGQRFS